MNVINPSDSFIYPYDSIMYFVKLSMQNTHGLKTSSL